MGGESTEAKVQSLPRANEPRNKKAMGPSFGGGGDALRGTHRGSDWHRYFENIVA